MIKAGDVGGGRAPLGPQVGYVRVRDSVSVVWERRGLWALAERESGRQLVEPLLQIEVQGRPKLGFAVELGERCVEDRSAHEITHSSSQASPTVTTHSPTVPTVRILCSADHPSR